MPEAIALEERVLADRERTLGDEHPDTLSVRADLAGSYWSAGRARAACTPTWPTLRTRRGLSSPVFGRRGL